MTWLFRILESMTPELVGMFKDGLKELLNKLEAKALETPNKWDDWGVEMMKKVFGCE